MGNNLTHIDSCIKTKYCDDCNMNVANGQFHCCSCKRNLSKNYHCCKCGCEMDGLYEYPFRTESDEKNMRNRSKNYHCCECKKYYTHYYFKKNFDRGAKKCYNYHCDICHLIFVNKEEDACNKIKSWEYAHCCKCKKVFDLYKNHCCSCGIVYKKYEKHCCSCKSNYEENENHCCSCKSEYTKNANHCCLCKLEYKKTHICTGEIVKKKLNEIYWYQQKN